MPYSDKEKQKEYQASRKEKHRAEARTWARLQREKDPEKVKQQNRAKVLKYRLAHPEGYLLRNARKRAKQLGLEFNLQESDIIIPEKCPVFNIPLVVNTGGSGYASPNSPTIDRLDSAKGYVSGNVWVISWRANKIKSDASLDELETLVRALKLRS